MLFKKGKEGVLKFVHHKAIIFNTLGFQFVVIAWKRVCSPIDFFRSSSHKTACSVRLGMGNIKS